MLRSISVAVLLAVGLVAPMACSPDVDSEASNASRSPGSEESAVSSSSSDVAGSPEIPRGDFVLCPAIEPIAGDLTSLAGFELDTSREIEAVLEAGRLVRDALVQANGG